MRIIAKLPLLFVCFRGSVLAFFATPIAGPRRSSSLHAAAPPQNEFSRTVDPERVLRNKRDYVCTIQATDQECQALATRFDLPDLKSLSASLVLRGSRRTGDDIQVQGTLTATVTRTCVRTNQAFTQELSEQPLVALVRPVTPLSTLLALEETTRPPPNSNKKSSSRRANTVDPEDMDLMQLQRMLQQDIRSEDDDVLMEDEAIYATGGMLDIGELVAQLFWLSLDPYPKKPGTDPVQASISSS